MIVSVPPGRASLFGVGTVKEMNGHPPGSIPLTFGIVAHDAMQDELCLFARANRRLLKEVRLVAPEDTARALEDVGVGVESLAPTLHGGDLQLAVAVVEGRIDAVIFLADPIVALAGEPDIATMLKVCDLERVPLATNLASAEIILHRLAVLERGEGGSKIKVETFRRGNVVRMTRHPSGRNTR